MSTAPAYGPCPQQCTAWRARIGCIHVSLIRTGAATTHTTLADDHRTALYLLAAWVEGKRLDCNLDCNLDRNLECGWGGP